MATIKAGKTLVVVGGGAAGFFCAVNAAHLNKDLQVIILEKTGKLLSKVRISGGGRCNVTHACYSVSELVKKYPRGGPFLKKTFHQFNCQDTIDWFQSKGVALKTEADGRMFPESDLSQTIIDCLLQEAQKLGIKIQLHSEITGFEQKGGQFELNISGKGKMSADYLALATGGYPKTAMFDWLRTTGHGIEPPVPSLFTFNTPKHPLTALMGLSVPEVIVKINGTKLVEKGPVLCTHWGLSGPAILRLSAWGARLLAERNWQFDCRINWLPHHNEETLRQALQQLRLEKSRQQVHHKNPFGLPTRLWTLLLELSGVPAQCRWAELPAKAQNLLALHCCNLELAVKGKTTFKEEFVTAGGIILQEVDPQTMMSKRIPGLFFAGEVLNIDGITGGFNFQNAWTTGYIAAKAITIPTVIASS